MHSISHTSRAVKRFGALAVLVDCTTLEAALHVHAHLIERPAAGQVELVPAAQTVLVRFNTAEQADAFMAAPDLPATSGDVRTHGQTATIDVVYDGQDVTEVASLLGISQEAVVYAHTTGHWSVAFAGFAPGFFYLHRHDNVLDVPRRTTPRTAVPAGSVGLAGDFSGIYPRTSPGGWQLIGHTDAPLWDLGRETPALLEPGLQVQFRAVRELVQVPEQSPEQGTAPSADSFSNGAPTLPPVLTVNSPGALTLFQDPGRKGLTHWGVSPSGFADPAAAKEANRLVGNLPGATVLENLAGGLVLTSLEDTVLALTGAKVTATISQPEGTQPDVGEQAEDPEPFTPLVARAYAPFALKAGQKLTLSSVKQGLRVYLAVRGGFAAPFEAASSSRDTLASLGADPLTAGDQLQLASLPTSVVGNPAPSLPLPVAGETLEIRVIPGPRDDWFTADSLARFGQLTWQVSEASDRIGVRLLPAETPDTQTPLTRAITGELPSEGMVPGAIQVPPSGEPVVFLADHPVTGGYPVIATVHPADLRLLAQSPSQTLIRFVTEMPQEPIEITPQTLALPITKVQKHA
ncbi:carboxyltransferase domain-containing protein [Rothia sp. LK2492]|uniref:5-oxoprolinase subunit B/C family protein n=1 Tax=Rothia sp. LK2492 TaxID=3114370 RepID=UPI0034CF5400